MAKMIFVNLPVRDLPRSVAFYEAIGATRNAKFSDDTAAAMVFSDTISVMLLTHAKFGEFTGLPIADANTSTQVLICMSEDSREGVDRITQAALAAGASEPRAAQDYGIMYGRSFTDPDGHIYEPMWMDPAAAEQGASAFETADA